MRLLPLVAARVETPAILRNRTGSAVSLPSQEAPIG